MKVVVWGSKQPTGNLTGVGGGCLHQGAGCAINDSICRIAGFRSPEPGLTREGGSCLTSRQRVATCYKSCGQSTPAELVMSGCSAQVTSCENIGQRRKARVQPKFPGKQWGLGLDRKFCDTCQMSLNKKISSLSRPRLNNCSWGGVSRTEHCTSGCVTQSL